MTVLLAAFFVVLADFFSKAAVQARMVEGQSIPVIPDVFHLTYVTNTGAAFGLFEDRTTFFVAVTALVLIGVLLYLRELTAGQLLLQLAVGLIAGGATGNLIDRVRWGYVIDFIDFRVWPVFNLADAAIVVGTILFAWSLYRDLPRV